MVKISANWDCKTPGNIIDINKSQDYEKGGKVIN
jgi:hypothetical protein